MAPLAMGMTRDIITLFKFLYHTLLNYLNLINFEFLNFYLFIFCILHVDLSLGKVGHIGILLRKFVAIKA